MTDAIREEIAAERRRQIEAEGYSLEHDDMHHWASDLYLAAISYIRSAEGDTANAKTFWPWKPESFKPTTPRRDLVKAGALMMAEQDLRTRRGIRCHDYLVERLDKVVAAIAKLDAPPSPNKCDCIPKVNALLKEHNTTLVFTMFGQNKVVLATEKIEKRRDGKKAVTFLASYCPMCGVKY